MFYLKRFIKTLYAISQFSPFALFYMIKAIVLEWILQWWSLKRLPAAAKAMGLSHKKSDRIREFGKIKGKIGDATIEVVPNNHTESYLRISYPKRLHGCYVATRKPTYRAKKGSSDFKTKSRKFNTLFKTIRAKEKPAALIAEDDQLHEAAIRFYSDHFFHIDSIIIDEMEMHISLSYSFYFFPHIPPGKLEPLVKGALEIAERITELHN